MKDYLLIQLSWADYLIIAVVLISTVISIMRGFVKEAISLATWVLAMWIGLQFAPLLAESLQEMISNSSVRLVLSFLMLFLGVFVLGGLINYLVVHLVAKTGLSKTNRLMGSVFGLLRGVLFVSFLILVARYTAIPDDPWWQDSVMIQKLNPVADTIARALPEKIHYARHAMLKGRHS